MLTIFYGKDSDGDERTALCAHLEKNFPSVECYFIEGNQEIAAYIFVAE